MSISTAMRSNSLALGAGDAVIVATQGRRDREALAAALKTPAGYVGMVGSRRKVSKLREALSSDIPAPRLAGLHGPAGLDIGAIEPEEIALSILGEIVGERRLKARDVNTDSLGIGLVARTIWHSEPLKPEASITCWAHALSMKSVDHKSRVRPHPPFSNHVVE